jgi:hypothetical protein
MAIDQRDCRRFPKVGQERQRLSQFAANSGKILQAPAGMQSQISRAAT